MQAKLATSSKNISLILLFIYQSLLFAQPGEIKWTVPTNIIGWGSPAIGEDGTIYVCGGEAGNLYAIRGSAPLASSHWPKMQRDNLNSGLRQKKIKNN